MDKRYFTVAEANSMVAHLEQCFGRMVQLQAQLRQTYARLEAAGFAPLRDDFSLSPEGAHTEVIDDLASMKTLVDALKEDVAALRRQGCIVKDVDAGLVDWYACKEGRDVFLCWKLGEKEVRYWHDVDVGFAGRRPISDW